MNSIIQIWAVACLLVLSFVCVSAVPLSSLQRSIEGTRNTFLSELSRTSDACTYGGIMGQCTSISVRCAGQRYSGLCSGSTDVQCCIIGGKSVGVTPGSEQVKITQTTLQRLSETEHRSKWARFKQMHKPVLRDAAHEQEVYLTFRQNRIENIYLNDRYGSGNVMWSSVSPFSHVKPEVFARQRTTARLIEPKPISSSRSFVELQGSSLSQSEAAKKHERTGPLAESDIHWQTFSKLVAHVESLEAEMGITSLLEVPLTSLKKDEPLIKKDEHGVGWITRPIGGNLIVDYRDLFPVVRDQGDCGSCWAFATSAVLEAQAVRAGIVTTPRMIAPQWLVNCDPADPWNTKKLGQAGCDGGHPPAVFQTIMKMSPAWETELPYKEVQSECTMLNGGSVPLRVKETGYASKYGVSVDPTTQKNVYEYRKPDEAGILAALKKYGPMTVSMNVHKWKQFVGGIMPSEVLADGNPFSECECGHAMVLAGYGEENGKYFWLLRNSWGVKWGEEGYLRVPANVGSPLAGMGNSLIYAVVGPP